MIEKTIESEFGQYTLRMNHGHPVWMTYQCCDFYSFPDDADKWSSCPCCGLKPKVWTFNNGRQTACGCGKSQYDHFSVFAESICSVISRCNGSAIEYRSCDLRRNWNDYCATMINPCSHADLRLLDRW